MINKEELSNQVMIGIEAQKLLSNNLLSSLFMSKKNHACTMFMESKRGDDKGRHELWQSVQGVLSIERELQDLVDGGNMSQKLLEEADRLAQTNNPHNSFGE